MPTLIGTIAVCPPAPLIVIEHVPTARPWTIYVCDEPVAAPAVTDATPLHVLLSLHADIASLCVAVKVNASAGPVPASDKLAGATVTAPGVLVGLTEGVALGEATLRVGTGETLGMADGPPVPVGAAVGLLAVLGLAKGDGLAEAIPIAEAVGLTLLLSVGTGEADGLGLPL